MPYDDRLGWLCLNFQWAMQHTCYVMQAFFIKKNSKAGVVLKKLIFIANLFFYNVNLAWRSYARIIAPSVVRIFFLRTEGGEKIP